MERDELLDRAKNIITGERQIDYGDARDNFRTIAKLWTVYLQRVELPLCETDVADMMILLKIARNTGDNKTDDSYVDIAGYAALGGEMNT